MQWYQKLKSVFDQALHARDQVRSGESELIVDEYNPASFGFNRATGPDKALESFEQFGAVIIDPGDDAPQGWRVGRIAVDGELDPRRFACPTSDAFRQATLALTFSCGKAVSGRFED